MTSESADEKRLRLVKVIVQPVLVLDDGDSLTEVKSTAMEVVGASWPSWSETAFRGPHLAELLAELLAQEEETAHA